MKESKIVNSGGVSFDISQVKCFKLNSNRDFGPTNKLVIEFKTRAEYIWNPEIGIYEKQLYNDTIEVEFSDWETARNYTIEFEEIWQDYLEE